MTDPYQPAHAVLARVGRLNKEGLVDVTFEVMQRTDIPALTRVMQRAFDHDAEIYPGIEPDGPEGYDNGDFFRQWVFGYDESAGYKILLNGKIVGGFVVWVFDHGNNMLGTIFVDPAYQGQGIGTRAWGFIEGTYPLAKTWTLGTPDWATRNHYFYETKCGFVKVREERAEDRDGVSFIYQKAYPRHELERKAAVDSQHGRSGTNEEVEE